MMTYDIQLKRIYSPADQADGARLLVDRLWPRGKRRECLALSDWCRNVAPSTSLRRAWHKEELESETFAQEYQRELEANPEVLVPLMRHTRQGRLTLLTATRNPEQSHLPILRRALLTALEEEDRQADGREPSSPTCYNRSEGS